MQGKVRWAMAARNQQKLATVRQELCKIHPSAQVAVHQDTRHAGVWTHCRHTLALQHALNLNPKQQLPSKVLVLQFCTITAVKLAASLSSVSPLETEDGLQDIPMLTGNLEDKQSLKAIAAQTRVVLTTAGPYSKLGSPVVEACLSETTHYCDLTGTAPAH